MQRRSCYALLLFLATAQTLIYLDLIRRPDLNRAAAFVGLAGLVVLTHYQAAVLGIAQGLILLVVQRRQILKLAPAALLAVPVLAVGLWHAPRLALFARPDVAWYPLVTGDTVGAALRYLTSSWWL